MNHAQENKRAYPKHLGLAGMEWGGYKSQLNNMAQRDTGKRPVAF